MKLKSFISIGLASSMLVLSVPQKASSNPAILAPIGGAALCAGTAGIACAFIGGVTLLGAGWAIYEANNREYIGNDKGEMYALPSKDMSNEEKEEFLRERHRDNVAEQKRKDREGMMQNPKAHDERPQFESSGAREEDAAIENCQKIAALDGRIFIGVEEDAHGIYQCEFRANQ